MYFTVSINTTTASKDSKQASKNSKSKLLLKLPGSNPNTPGLISFKVPINTTTASNECKQGQQAMKASKDSKQKL
jgi:hypothetical protein